MEKPGRILVRNARSWTNSMHKKRISSLVGLFSLLYFCFPENAYAYLDPGTGSMLLSAVISVVSVVYFVIRGSWNFLHALFYRLIGKAKVYSKNRIVFYSEGASYWNTFRPVLEALDRRGVKALYMTSDLKDPGLAFASDHIEAQYIGEGNAAFMTLNLLDADVCAMTTPGLDVLQIRRSKGVRHYTHIVHSVTDMALYKLYSFDYYDSVMCAGPHQERSLRFLEELRGTTKKDLFVAGCAYFDVLAARFAMEGGNENVDSQCVLVAPTWGSNGLLSRFGAKLVKPLAEAGFSVIIRPHPQSFRVEKAMIDRIRAELAVYPNVRWDAEPDGFTSLKTAAVLISDLSGVVFDFAFVFERPVITVRFEPDFRGLDGNDLPYPAWELAGLDRIGRRVDDRNISSLPEVVRSLTSDAAFRDGIRTFRESDVYHFAHAGEVLAEQIVALAARYD